MPSKVWVNENAATTKSPLGGLASYPARYLHGDCIAIDTWPRIWSDRSRVSCRGKWYYAFPEQRGKGTLTWHQALASHGPRCGTRLASRASGSPWAGSAADPGPRCCPARSRPASPAPRPRPRSLVSAECHQCRRRRDRRRLFRSGRGKPFGPARGHPRRGADLAPQGSARHHLDQRPRGLRVRCHGGSARNGARGTARGLSLPSRSH